MAKKDFSWDVETEIGTVEVNDKERRIVKTCLLNEKAYISIIKEKFYKDNWNIVGNATFQAETFDEIVKVIEKAKEAAK